MYMHQVYHVHCKYFRYIMYNVHTSGILCKCTYIRYIMNNVHTSGISCTMYIHQVYHVQCTYMRCACTMFIHRVCHVQCTFMYNVHTYITVAVQFITVHQNKKYLKVSRLFNEVQLRICFL